MIYSLRMSIQHSLASQMRVFDDSTWRKQQQQWRVCINFELVLCDWVRSLWIIKHEQRRCNGRDTKKPTKKLMEINFELQTKSDSENKEKSTFNEFYSSSSCCSFCCCCSSHSLAGQTNMNFSIWHRIRMNLSHFVTMNWKEKKCHFIHGM